MINMNDVEARNVIIQRAAKYLNCQSDDIMPSQIDEVITVMNDRGYSLNQEWQGSENESPFIDPLEEVIDSVMVSYL